MIILFYEAVEKELYICTSHEPTKKVKLDDPGLMDYIPNEDILYVTNGHYITKSQFEEWLSGKFVMQDPQQESSDNFQGNLENKNKKYLHTTSNGTVLIEDIQTERFPEGIALHGKWDFVDVDEIGETNLQESAFFKILYKKKKVEIVDANYIRKHQHKIGDHRSPTERALDRILVPVGRRAEDVASEGGLTGDDITVTVDI